MKNIFLIIITLCAADLTFSQEATSTMSVLVNDEEFVTEPRRIRIGGQGYITGSMSSPDKSLRIWLAAGGRKEQIEPGTYLIVNADKPDTKDFKRGTSDTYVGIAAIRYSNETRAPRMEYHVGDSENNGETLEVTYDDEGYLVLQFSARLTGTYWKERTSATIVGGTGRIMGKMQDKAISKGTGWDVGMDPEGNGYRKQKQTDTIVLTDGLVRLKPRDVVD